jgi:hypothetical protein
VSVALSSGVGRAPLRDHRSDCYDTPIVAVRALMCSVRLPPVIWEPACGIGNIVIPLRAAGHTVIATDLNDRGCPDSLARIDFLLPCNFKCDAIISNPPYSLAEEFVATALERAPFVIMLLRLAFLESERRSHILDNGKLARVLVFAKRLPMMHREGWQGPRATSAIPFAWFVWHQDHSGPANLSRISSTPQRQQSEPAAAPLNPEFREAAE